MFTGLVEATGELRGVERGGEGATLRIRTTLSHLVLGESVATNGVCLTVRTIHDDGFSADASSETLAKSTLGALPPGALVHLERALRLDSRLGGHLVSGHVDGVGELIEARALGESKRLSFEVPERLAPFLAPKGSVCIDGVSLTVNGVTESRFDVVLVPFTQSETTFTGMLPGARVNIEVDVLAKYVASLLGKPGVDEESRPGGLTLDVLRKHGYL